MNYITEKLSLKDKTCTCMTHSYLKNIIYTNIRETHAKLADILDLIKRARVEFV